MAPAGVIAAALLLGVTDGMLTERESDEPAKSSE